MRGQKHFAVKSDGSIIITMHAFYDKEVDAASLAISEEVAKKQMHPSFYDQSLLSSGIDQLVAEDKSAGIICLSAIEILSKPIKGKDDRLHTLHIEPVHDHSDINKERGAAHVEIRYSPYFESNKGQRQLCLFLAAVANKWFESHQSWGRLPVPMPGIDIAA